MHNGWCSQGLRIRSRGDRQQGHEVLPQVEFLLWLAYLRLFTVVVWTLWRSHGGCSTSTLHCND